MREPKKERARRGTAEIEVRIDRRTGERRYYTKYTEADGRRRHVRLGGASIEEARKNRRAILARVDAGKAGREVQTPEQKARARVTVQQLAERFCGKHDDWKTGHGGAMRIPRIVIKEIGSS